MSILTRPVYLFETETYLDYPCIKSVTEYYKDMFKIDYFISHTSRDGTRVLLTSNSYKNSFDQIEYLIDAKSKQLIWHGVRSVERSFNTMYYTFKNMFVRIVQVDSQISFGWIGTSFSKLFDSSNIHKHKDGIIRARLTYKLCRLIKLIS